MTPERIERKLERLKNPQKAVHLKRFFKTGPGEYGEKDVFWGITVPELRKLAQKIRGVSTNTVLGLLKSPVHEKRMLALIIMVDQYEAGEKTQRKNLYEFYLGNTEHINSWDLVDGSAPHIVGAYLMEKNRKPLYRLARSENLWERRIAIVSTLYFIRRGEFAEVLKISKILLNDAEDLIQKAVGWMLREVGKRDPACAEAFLAENYRKMPRTMLRYAIEKYTKPQRQRYLTGKI